MSEHAEKSFKYISPSEALGRILEYSRLSPKVVEVDVYDSLGHVLAEDIVSPTPIPKDDVAHFDGYAVRSSDTLRASTLDPVRLKIVGRIDSIREHNLSIGEGESVYVVTGAKIPRGADAIIPFERVKKIGEYLEITEPVKKGDYIIFKGVDIRAEEIIQKRGDIIRPQTIRYLLDIGRSRIKVFAKPRIAIVGVGDELTTSIEEVEGKKLETSSTMLQYYIKEFGGIPTRLAPVPDDPSRIMEVVKNSLRDNDVCITIGGASLGPRDLCWTTLSKMSECMPIARGLRIQPGRPTSIVLYDGKPVIMLPGPVQSTISGAVNIVIPLISYLQGLGARDIFPRIYAELDEDLTTKEYRSFTRIRFVKIVKNNERYIAKPVLGESSMIKPLLASNGFIKIPEHVEKITRGSRIEVYLLSWTEILHLFSRDNDFHINSQ